MALKIIVSPNDPNPYQNLLYNGLENHFLVEYVCPKSYAEKNLVKKGIARVLEFLILPFKLMQLKSQNYGLFHLHWIYGFITRFKILRIIHALYFIFILNFLKLLKFKIVWTVHNVMPHEKQFINDKYISRFLSNLADAKIVHSASVIEEMKNAGMNTHNTHIIPHGNYIGIYKNQISKNEARKSLGLSKNDFVFLFFGAIRKYKGIEDLLESFSRIVKKGKNIKLIIAGRPDEASKLTLIEDYKKLLKQDLILNIGFIDDEKVQNYFNSADVVVLPFKKITTSGSAILALSFAKPIIAPRMACFNELPENLGFFYKPGEKNALYKAMEKALKSKKKLKKMGKNALEYAKSLSWDKIAEKTYKLFQSLIKRQKSVAEIEKSRNNS